MARSSLTHDTKRTGPVPTGLALKVSLPTASTYFRGTICPP
jgi:hypothetical protein